MDLEKRNGLPSMNPLSYDKALKRLALVTVMLVTLASAGDVAKLLGGGTTGLQTWLDRL